MHTELRFLVVPLLLGLFLVVGLPPAAAQNSPTLSLGNFWEYTVEARLDNLFGMGNISGAMVADGQTRAEVIDVANGGAMVSWEGELELRGSFTLPDDTAQAAISGTIETTYLERRQEPHFLPVGFDAKAATEGFITLFVSFPFAVAIEVNATLPPTASSPAYPIEVGDRTVTTEADLATNVTVDLLGMGIQNSTEEHVVSSIRWNVTASESVEVPAGTFSGLQVRMEATAGFVPSPFQALIPGAVQVTHHSPEVGNPVLFQFFVNETEAGTASLETFSFASSVPPPFWQNPIFLGVLLAVPIALLLYRYWSERRKGL